MSFDKTLLATKKNDSSKSLYLTTNSTVLKYVDQSENLEQAHQLPKIKMILSHCINSNIDVGVPGHV